MNEVQVTEDDEPFMIQQAAVDKRLDQIREITQKVSLTSVCLECGEPIGEARKKAIPSATLCIDCAEYLDRHATR
jgi:phage/conjugal plasmid C-4 type zinc finger TraR family protein